MEQLTVLWRFSGGFGSGFYSGIVLWDIYVLCQYFCRDTGGHAVFNIFKMGYEKLGTDKRYFEICVWYLSDPH